MNIIESARKAFELFQQGRTALESLAQSVKDGKHALSANDQVELNEMLEAERAQSQAAHDNLQNAINTYRSGARG